MCHSVEPQLPTPSSQHQVLRPNLKKANQYVLNVKHELTYMQEETYNSLYAQDWLHLVFCATQPVYS